MPPRNAETMGRAPAHRPCRRRTPGRLGQGAAAGHIAALLGPAIIAGSFAWSGSPAVAAGCAPPKPVQFAPGASAAVVDGGIPRGDRDCYVLQAGKGQTMAVTQPDPADDNIVFQIYRPTWSISHDDEGWAFAGAALPGTEETHDTSHWSGALPVSGRYLLVVGTSRGSGSYRLRIDIR